MRIPPIDYTQRAAELHLTYRCNLACCACSRACFHKEGHTRDMSEWTFLNTLDKIEKLGFRKELVYIGGEPTLHPQILDFMRIGKSRGFRQHIYSNAYTQKSRDILHRIRIRHLARTIATTEKLSGSVEKFNNPWIFCSAVDMGTSRYRPCRYGTGKHGAGYSVDELGCTPCCIGGEIAKRMAPEVLQPIERLKDDKYIKAAFELMCQHCGSFLHHDRCWKKCDQTGVVNVKGTAMTQTWIKAFKQGTLGF